MRVRTILWGSVVLLAAAAVRAEPTAKYDLAACIKAALQSDPDLKAAAAEVARARAQLDEARAGKWGQAEYTQILGFVPGAKGDILDPPQENRNSLLKGLGPFTRLNLSVNVPLWTFGKLDAALEAAQNGLDAQQAGGAARRADIIMNVKRVYYGVLLTEQLSLVLGDMLDTMEKAVRKTEERLETGTSSVTEIDLLKLKTGRAKFARGVAEVKASAALSRSALARTIGLPVNAHVELEEQRLKPVEASLAPLEQYLADGPPRRPETDQIRTGIAAQAARVELQEAELYPSVFLSTGFQYGWAPGRTRQKNPFAAEDFNYTHPVAALGLHWDLNILGNVAKIDQARADLDKLMAQQRSAESGFQLEIHKAYGEVVEAQETMKSADEGRRAGRSLLVLTVANFDLGIGDAEELFKGLGAYTEASSDYLRAVHDFNVAIGALSRAVGSELAGIEY
jgi:outer membrane protein TolC